MQAVSAAFQTAAAAAARTINWGVLISWTRSFANAAQFFTIGTSTIGGPDPIKGAGGAITLFDKYAYTNYGQLAGMISIQRDLGAYPYGAIMGVLDVELDNTSKLFLPGYDSTIGNYILPNRPIKISFGLNGEHINQFVGFTDIPDNRLVQRTTILKAFDAMNYLDNYVSATGVLTNQTADQIITTLLQEAGFSSTMYSIETSLQKVIGFYAPTGQKIGDVIRQLCEAEQGVFFVDETGILTFWNRLHMHNNTTNRYTFNYSNMRDVQFAPSMIINDVIVRAKPRAAQPKQKIWELGSPMLIPAGQSVDIVADVSDDNGSLPLISVDTPLYFASATTSNYATNAAQDRSGQTLSSYISLTAQQNLGTSYKMTFLNSYSQDIYVTDIALYGIVAKVTQVIEERRTDTSSVTNYGTNPQNNGEPVVIENDAIQDRDTARALSYNLLADHKDPRRRLVVDAFAAPHLQFGDVITVNIQDTGEIKTYYIVGEQKKLNRLGDFAHLITVEERVVVPFFTIGASTIGGTDVLAP
jgi:hypothetical protein